SRSRKSVVHRFARSHSTARSREKASVRTQLLSVCKPATEGGDPMMTASTETILLSGKDRLRPETGTSSPVSVQMTSAEVTLIRRVQSGDSDAFFDLVRP